MKISVIIPTLNEAGCVGNTLRLLRQQRPFEIIVADGGSTDGTLHEAQDADRIVTTARGRAVQMNAGAAEASGSLLVFLHADCTLDGSALAHAAEAFRRRKPGAACFTMRVAAEGCLYRAIDACATLRVRLTGLIYGDQGLVVRRDDFLRVGGFPPVKLMEDILLSRLVRTLGPVAVLAPRIFVSPRRWQRTGLVRQTLRNWALTILAAAGASPDGLASFYPNIR
jgi:rSAM/selenodomain-associated transferase 2